MAKALQQEEMKLGGVLVDSLSAEASTATIRCRFYDSDSKTTQRTPHASTKRFTIDAENTQGKISEVILCASHATLNGVTTLTNVTRGLQRDNTIDLTGSATRAQAWDAGTPIGVSTTPYDNNLMKAYFEGTEQIPGNIDIGGTLEVDGVIKANDQVQLTGTDTYLDKVGTDMVFKDANNVLTTLSDLTAAAGTDTKVRVSANDTTSGFLNGKLVAGNGVSFTENNDGANETLTIGFSIASTYGIDAAGNDTYAVTLTPALTAYVDGQFLQFEAGTANTIASTVDYSALGAIPIKKGDYFDTVTGDITEDKLIAGYARVKTVTFTGALLIAAVSGTLTGNWGYKTGVYSVLFSNGDRRDVTLTKGATTATWSGGLSAEATANAVAQWFDMLTPTSALEGGNNASENHWHDLLVNNSKAQKHFFRTRDCELTGASTNLASSVGSVTTTALNNGIARYGLACSSLSSTVVSVHDRNPSFRVAVNFSTATAQEGFIGYINQTIAGTSLENSVMILDHFGFIVEDSKWYISCANGATQTKTDISVAIPSVTAGHMLEAYFDGTTVTFKIDNAVIGTSITNVPDGNLDAWTAAVIADVSAVAKTLYVHNNGWIAFDEV